MNRSPVTVARLHRIYTDFPILPESNNSGHPMRKVLLRIVYPARAGNVNGFGCILLTGRLLSGILFSGHHHRPRLSLSDDLPSTVVTTMQVPQSASLFPSKNICHNCYNWHNCHHLLSHPKTTVT